jgi:signal transduction histidine kinase
MDVRRGGAGRSLAEGHRVVDVVVVLAGLALTVLAVKGRWSVSAQPVIALAGTAASLALWWRRRWPVAAGLAGVAGLALSGNPIPAIVGLYSGGAYASRRRAGLLAVAGWAGFAVWVRTQSGGWSFQDTAAAGIAAALPVAAGVYVATRRELADSWRERAQRLESERHLREDRARIAERTRIAREMHDVLAHKVSLIALHAGALELQARGSLPPVEEGAALIRTTAREALQELRYVLGVLQDGSRPPVDSDDEALRRGETFADLPSLVAAARRAGQRVDLVDDAGPLPPSAARVVYRVAQEGLTNARKHAPDAPVTLTVHRGDDTTVTVVVRNPPTASRPLDLPGAGSGLVGLAERVRLAGGSLHSGRLSPEAGADWQVRAVVPVSETS